MSHPSNAAERRNAEQKHRFRKAEPRKAAGPTYKRRAKHRSRDWAE